jgi:two-component system sensor histidine kinase KdpD
MRGRHKIFLGYANGVGKTHSMLEEALRRKSRGQDVMIGYVDPASRPHTLELVSELETIAGRTVNLDGVDRVEMNLSAILERKPDVVIVDELAHKNPPGSPNSERWQDVDSILAAGISVLSTMNIYDLESLNDRVSDIVGVPIHETVPDRIFHEASEVELVDLTVRALLNRLERGDVFPMEDVSQAKLGMFQPPQLFALREIALREIAGRIDEDLVEYRKEQNIERPWATNDKVMICIGASRSSLRLLRRGWRTAKRHHGEVFAVFVEDHKLDDKEQKVMLEDERLAARLGIPIIKLQGHVGPEIVKYARENNVTQLVIGHSERSKLQELTKTSLLSELAKSLRTIDFLVVAAEKHADH